MAEKKVYLVFSRKPAGVPAEEWHRWYDHHLRHEVLPTPGFVSGQRFAVTPTDGTEFPFDHLALYEYEGNWEDWNADMYRQVEEGVFVQPPFFDEIAFAYMDCEALSERCIPER